MFRGIFQILHTPFDDGGAIDWDSYADQIEYSVSAGSHGLVAPAMASEFFTLSDRERFEVVEFALDRIAGRVPFVACVQGLTVHHALDFARHARQYRADGLMAMPPYLRKPTRPGVVAYYGSLAEIGLPLIIQNAPGPVGTPLDPDALADLARSSSSIAYVKEETPAILQRISRTLENAGDALDGIFGGANGLYLIDELTRGACGNMPAGGLIDLQVRVFEHWDAGRRDEAEFLHNRLLALLSIAAVHGVVFHKYVLWKRGVIASPAVRDPQALPLDAQDEQTIAALWRDVEDDALSDYAFRT